MLAQPDAELVATDIVLMELLAGARDDAHEVKLRRLLARCTYVPVESPDDFLEAASLYRRCRAGGTTIRKMADCLIAAVAMRAGARLLHFDRDFDALVPFTELKLDNSSRLDEPGEESELPR